MVQLWIRLRRGRQILGAAFVAKKASGERCDRTAAMRHDVANVGSTGCRSTGNEIDDRTAHIRVVFNGGLIDTGKEIPYREGNSLRSPARPRAYKGSLCGD